MATNFLNFTKHAVAGSSRLKATTAGHIYDIVADKNYDNGTLITKGDYVENQTYKAGAAATVFEGKIIDIAANGNYYVEVVTPGDALLILTSPLIYEDYTSQMTAESNFFNAKGDIMRAYELYKGDVFELSAEGFEGAVMKGDKVKVTTTLLKQANV